MYAELLDKGYACLRRGDPDAALMRFQQACELEPDRPQAYFALAIAYLELEMSEKVTQSLEEALRVDPAYVTARAFLAIEYLKCYDVHRAEDELERALQDEPTNLLVHVKYAEYYYRLGFYNRAVELLERGLKRPHGADEHIVAMARQLLTQARQKSRNIILREPPDPRRWLRLFTWFRQRKRDKQEEHQPPAKLSSA
ncbi:MAG TPA: tetratricopeptide repeat protein [Ktedonobacteraceae bacterium]